jgi:hypothetical protein
MGTTTVTTHRGALVRDGLSESSCLSGVAGCAVAEATQHDGLGHVVDGSQPRCGRGWLAPKGVRA